MSTLVIEPARGGLRGRLRVPGDKSISHRALLLAALADGRSELRALSEGSDVRHTAEAMRRFGADVVRRGETTVVDGGRSRLGEPDQVIDVGNSGTGIRLLTGWAAGLPGLAVLQGDASIARRPMDRVTVPLRAMGARLDGREDGKYPPLVVRGGALRGIDYRLPVASAQVKAAVLFAGLAAEGATTVREDVATRAHTEEMFAACGVDVEVSPGSVTVRPSKVHRFALDVPADPSQAAFWIVAACVVPGSDLVVERVYIGTGRAGFLDVLGRMSAAITLEREDPVAHTADVRVRAAPLVATTVGGSEVASLIDEIPALAVAAAYAEGVTTFADAAELRIKESDRIATVVSELTAVGVHVEPRPDGLVVYGGAGVPPAGGRVDSHGDHRIAMAMAVAGLGARHPVQIAGWEAVATSYPTFEEDLRRCVS